MFAIEAEKKWADVTLPGNANEAEPITVDPARSWTDRLTVMAEGL